MTLILSDKIVREMLSIEGCIEVVEEAEVAYSRGETVAPLRMTLVIPAENAEQNLMPAWMAESRGGAAFGFKSVTFFPGNEAKGLPLVVALVALLEPDSGRLLALMNGTWITTARTAAASAVATRALANRDAKVLALIGAGTQAGGHLSGMIAVRPIEEVRVTSLSLAESTAFIEAKRRDYPHVVFTAVETAEEAVYDADLVCTVTYSAEPVLHASWLKKGVHINAVGSHQPTAREIDGETMRLARVVVDSREAALHECGDCLIPMSEGLFGEEHVSDEIGEVLGRVKSGRSFADQITVYQSCGLAIQDLAAAVLTFARARDQNVGVEIDL